MTAKLISHRIEPSKSGGIVYHAFFKGEDGKSYDSYLYPKYRNFPRWMAVLNAKDEVWLENLNTRGRLIDADSNFRRIKLEKVPA